MAEFRNPNSSLGFGIEIGNTPSTNAIENSYFLLVNSTGPTGPIGLTGPTGPIGPTNIIELTGTVNQVTVSLLDTITVLSTPQNMETFSDPVFNSVTFSSAGGIPTELKYYEAGNFNVSITGAWSSTLSINFTRIGNRVTLIFPSDIGTRTIIGANIIILGTPSRLSNNNDSHFGLLSGINNGNNTVLSYSMENGGLISIGNSSTDSTAGFTPGINIITGTYGWSISYNTINT